jgi:hypothetical protein
VLRVGVRLGDRAGARVLGTRMVGLARSIARERSVARDVLLTPAARLERWAAPAATGVRRRKKKRHSPRAWRGRARAATRARAPRGRAGRRAATRNHSYITLHSSALHEAGRKAGTRKHILHYNFTVHYSAPHCATSHDRERSESRRSQTHILLTLHAIPFLASYSSRCQTRTIRLTPAAARWIATPTTGAGADRTIKPARRSPPSGRRTATSPRRTSRRARAAA